MLPLSTNANLCRLLIRPSGEQSRARMRHHSLIARRSEFGVLFQSMVEDAKYMSAQARHVRLPTMAALSRLRNVAPGPPTKRRRGGAIPRLLWSHPYQSPKLGRCSSPVVPPTIRLA